MSLALSRPGHRVHRLFTILPLDIFIFLCYNNTRKKKRRLKKMIYEVDGSYYHNADNAYEAARQLIDKEDLYRNLTNKIDLWDLFNWCFQQESFLEHFQNEILGAEEDAIEDHVDAIEFLNEKDEKHYFELMNPEFLDEEEEE